MITHAITDQDELDWMDKYPYAVRYDVGNYYWYMQDTRTPNVLVPVGQILPPSRVSHYPHLGHARILLELGFDVVIQGRLTRGLSPEESILLD